MFGQTKKYQFNEYQIDTIKAFRDSLDAMENSFSVQVKALEANVKANKVERQAFENFVKSLEAQIDA